MTAVAKFSWVPLLPGKALEDHREQESAGERGADDHLGPVVRERGRVEAAGRGGRASS